MSREILIYYNTEHNNDLNIDKKESDRKYYLKNRDKILEYQREYRKNHKEQISITQKNCYNNKINQYKERRKDSSKLTRIRIKCIVMDHYGGKCNCCSEPRIEFLTIDHIEGGGNKHRLKLFNNHNQSGYRFYQWLKQNNFPKGFQVLCWNCNATKHYYNQCPHKRDIGGQH